jgi:acyl carrier protein
MDAQAQLDLVGMNTELLEEVKAFVAEFWYEPKGGLSAETSVNDDLGMDGDDGVEFMEAFSVHFGVDLGAFPHDRYFGPEAAANPISIIAGIIRRVTTGKWSDLSPLTLRDLVEAVENRRWVVESRPQI